MFVVFVDVEIPQPEAALASLHEIVVPPARQMSGFVSGIWSMHGNERGRSAVIFDTFEHAEALGNRLRAQSPPNIRVTSVEVAEVVAYATP